MSKKQPVIFTSVEASHEPGIVYAVDIYGRLWRGEIKFSGAADWTLIPSPENP